MALGMSGLANDAASSAGNLQLGTENTAHQINMGGLQGSMGYEDQLANIYGINRGVNAQSDSADKAAAQAREGAIMSAAGSAAMMMMSDERAKTNVETSDSAGLELISNLGGHFYDYKEPEKHGQGRFFGPMAQELEKSKAGRSAVVERGGRKMVDTGRLTLALAGAVASKHRKDESEFAKLKRRMAELESA